MPDPELDAIGQEILKQPKKKGFDFTFTPEAFAEEPKAGSPDPELEAFGKEILAGRPEPGKPFTTKMTSFFNSLVRKPGVDYSPGAQAARKAKSQEMVKGAAETGWRKFGMGGELITHPVRAGVRELGNIGQEYLKAAATGPVQKEPAPSEQIPKEKMGFFEALHAVGEKPSASGEPTKEQILGRFGGRLRDREIQKTANKINAFMLGATTLPQTLPRVLEAMNKSVSEPLDRAIREYDKTLAEIHDYEIPPEQKVILATQIAALVINARPDLDQKQKEDLAGKLSKNFIRAVTSSRKQGMIGAVPKLDFWKTTQTDEFLANPMEVILKQREEDNERAVRAVEDDPTLSSDEKAKYIEKVLHQGGATDFLKGMSWEFMDPTMVLPLPGPEALAKVLPKGWEAVLRTPLGKGYFNKLSDMKAQASVLADVMGRDKFFKIAGTDEGRQYLQGMSEVMRNLEELRKVEGKPATQTEIAREIKAKAKPAKPKEGEQAVTTEGDEEIFDFLDGGEAPGFGIGEKARPKPLSLTESQAKVRDYLAMRSEPVQMDEIADALGLPPEQVVKDLSILELNSAVVKRPGSRFQAVGEPRVEIKAAEAGKAPRAPAERSARAKKGTRAQSTDEWLAEQERLRMTHQVKVNKLEADLAVAKTDAQKAAIQVKLEREQRLAAEVRAEQHRAEARTDELTGLGNTRARTEELEAKLKEPGEVIVVRVDLDNLKPINDTYKHKAGSTVIQNQFRTVQEWANQFKGLVYRVGGDEGDIILKGMDPMEVKTKLGDLQRMLLENQHEVAPGVFIKDQGASIGWASTKDLATRDVGSLMDAADRAMYVSKHGSKTGRFGPRSATEVTDQEVAAAMEFLGKAPRGGNLPPDMAGAERYLKQINHLEDEAEKVKTQVDELVDARAAELEVQYDEMFELGDRTSLIADAMKMRPMGTDLRLKNPDPRRVFSKGKLKKTLTWREMKMPPEFSPENTEFPFLFTKNPGASEPEEWLAEFNGLYGHNIKTVDELLTKLKFERNNKPDFMRDARAELRDHPLNQRINENLGRIHDRQQDMAEWMVNYMRTRGVGVEKFPVKGKTGEQIVQGVKDLENQRVDEMTQAMDMKIQEHIQKGEADRAAGKFKTVEEEYQALPEAAQQEVDYFTHSGQDLEVALNKVKMRWSGTTQSLRMNPFLEGEAGYVSFGAGERRGWGTWRQDMARHGFEETSPGKFIAYGTTKILELAKTADGWTWRIRNAPNPTITFKAGMAGNLEEAYAGALRGLQEAKVASGEGGFARVGREAGVKGEGEGPKSIPVGQVALTGMEKPTAPEFTGAIKGGMAEGDLKGLPLFEQEMFKRQAQQTNLLRQGMDALPGEKDVAAGEGGFINAWHGSPHKFEEFDAEKIGSGEGAQAFGHGLYFTSKKAIAREYAKDWNVLNPNVENWIQKAMKASKDQGPPSDTGPAKWIENQLGDLRKAKYKAQTKIDKFRAQKYLGPEWGLAVTHFGQATIELQAAEKALELFKKGMAGDTGSRLYKVTLHKGKTPDQYDYLKWDEPPIAKQVDKIINQAKAEGLFAGHEREWNGMKSERSGENLYTHIAEEFSWSPDKSKVFMKRHKNPEKEASLFLKRAGIDGVDYPAGSLSGMEKKGVRNYVVFDPKAITIEKRFTPWGEEGFVRWGRTETEDQGTAPIFYSGLVNTLEKKMPNAADPQTIRGIIKGISPEEIKWSGIEEFLAGKTKVTKQEVQDFLKGNELEVTEVVKGGRLKPEGEAGPVDSRGYHSYSPKYQTYVLSGDPREYRELLIRMPGGGGFQSGHWEEENVLSHVRFDDRYTPEGKKVLFIEEIQSDWHQQGKKEGYRGETPKKPEKLELAPGYRVHVIDDEEYAKALGAKVGDKVIEEHVDNPLYDEEWTEVTGITFPGTMSDEAVIEAHYQGSMDAGVEIIAGLEGPGGRDLPFIVRPGVPPAPFAKNWPELSMKRMLRWAAENGYDKVAWTTGKQQAERYDLSKQVSKIVWNERSEDLVAYDLRGDQVISKTVPKEKLADYIGKEAAEKILVAKPPEETWTWEFRKIQQELGGSWSVVLKTQSKELAWRGLEKVNTERLYGGYASAKDAAANIERVKFVANEENGMPWVHTLEGENLKIGGEGMKGFYDKIIPDFMNKYGKKWGASVKLEEIGSETGKRYPYSVKRELQGWSVVKPDGSLEQNESGHAIYWSHEENARTYAQSLEDRYNQGLNQKVHTVDVTPAMQKDVLIKGQPLWGEGGAVRIPPPAELKQRFMDDLGKAGHTLDAVRLSLGRALIDQFGLSPRAKIFSDEYTGIRQLGAVSAERLQDKLIKMFPINTPPQWSQAVLMAAEQGARETPFTIDVLLRQKSADAALAEAKKLYGDLAQVTNIREALHAPPETAPEGFGGGAEGAAAKFERTRQAVEPGTYYVTYPALPEQLRSQYDFVSKYWSRAKEQLLNLQEIERSFYPMDPRTGMLRDPKTGEAVWSPLPDYVYHLYKDPPAVVRERVMQWVSRKVGAEKPDFLQHRIIPTLADAKEMGLHPVTDPRILLPVYHAQFTNLKTLHMFTNSLLDAGDNVIRDRWAFKKGEEIKSPREVYEETGDTTPWKHGWKKVDNTLPGWVAVDIPLLADRCMPKDLAEAMKRIFLKTPHATDAAIRLFDKFNRAIKVIDFVNITYHSANMVRRMGPAMAELGVHNPLPYLKNFGNYIEDARLGGPLTKRYLRNGGSWVSPASTTTFIRESFAQRFEDEALKQSMRRKFYKPLGEELPGQGPAVRGPVEQAIKHPFKTFVSMPYQFSHDILWNKLDHGIRLAMYDAATKSGMNDRKAAKYVNDFLIKYSTDAKWAPLMDRLFMVWRWPVGVLKNYAQMPVQYRKALAFVAAEWLLIGGWDAYWEKDWRYVSPWKNRGKLVLPFAHAPTGVHLKWDVMKAEKIPIEAVESLNPTSPHFLGIIGKYIHPGIRAGLDQMTNQGDWGGPIVRKDMNAGEKIKARGEAAFGQVFWPERDISRGIELFKGKRHPLEALVPPILGTHVSRQYDFEAPQEEEKGLGGMGKFKKKPGFWTGAMTGSR